MAIEDVPNHNREAASRDRVPGVHPVRSRSSSARRVTKVHQRATSVCRLSPSATVHQAIQVQMGVGTRLLRVRSVVCEWIDCYRAERGWPAERAVLLLDQAPARGDAEAMRIFAAHNVTVVLFPPHLTPVLQPVDLGSKPRSPFLRKRWGASWGGQEALFGR
jgi:hypothetical protein